tara:strand:+ start:1258 stop:2235 length:978 start_codon:yes stop_codon:yes gene_type:complete
MRLLKPDYFLPENSILRSLSRIKYFDRIKWVRSKDVKVKGIVNQLRKNGYVILPEFIKGERLEQLRRAHSYALEQNLDFEEPCLAQNKIDSQIHKDLIDNKFKVSNEELSKRSLTFRSSDVSSYQEIVEKFKPSTLKTYIPQEKMFFDIWLDPFVTEVVENYMGLTPYLFEAYLRRNFPANHKVMNHYWHKDTNNKYLLLKMFVFLSDCTIENGPHEYIKGSIYDRSFNGQTYYSDAEVDAKYPQGCPERIQSIVKAGTIILEDTRGLHRAMIPEKGYRDLGYAVFAPKAFYSRMGKRHYGINNDLFSSLTKNQQKFIPEEFVVE